MMVFDGRQDILAFVKFEGDRIRLPSHLVERVGLVGSAPIDCWLFVVKPGRYRLVRQAATSVNLSRILRQTEEVSASGDVLDWTESNAEAAIPARLISCVASPRGPGWRISVPKEARQLATGERSFAFLLVVGGFVELWFPDPLREALSVPISEILP